ncbi:carbohydrate ABC transporter permease (plasmid) [Peteryoungia desertarenae]|uniref:sn-glycerol-3-phosphate transport system permease protein UgpE n=1 Tax=Peteryoungia desertarenae TaxID=1813451 RepID=A0ABX6QSK9_9HYPH|nr:carbohydrate ABC transporter permease [Peteryoungia desertarenae]QLF71538.1 carbohydrate ABC transporter permease [Peteryoungia desertarenae]
MAFAGKGRSVSALIVRYGVLTVIAAIFIFPLVFMVVSSLKPDGQLLRDASSIRAFLPIGEISFDNYFAAFERAPIGLFVFNSVTITGLTVAASILVGSLAAFAFTYMDWSGRDFLFSMVLATLIIPFETIAIPLLLEVNNLPWITSEGLVTGWLNSYHVQIIPWIGDGLTIFLFVQYFKDLPSELIDAAKIDGANWLQIYWLVIMPISGPVIATAAILKFLIMYSQQYLWPLLVTQSEEYRPVMVGLQYFFQLNVAWGEVMAYLSIITVPVLIFYLFLQRAFIASIASTGLKG